MLLFCVKHSRPDVMNAARELTKALGKCAEAAHKEMLRVAHFVIGAKGKGLKVEPRVNDDGEWELVVFSDSDWAGNPDDRKSVGCFIAYLCGAPIAWRSKSQKVVSLSSSEAEFYACSEAVKEVPFIAQIMLFMGFKLKIPVDIKIDNIGAIFMSENRTSSGRTRHMDTRDAYVNQLQEEGLIKVSFVSTHDNPSDVGTKNVTGEVYQKHEPTMLIDKESVSPSDDHHDA